MKPIRIISIVICSCLITSTIEPQGLTLKNVIIQGLQANSNIIIAEQQVEASNAESKSALTNFLPKVSARTSYTRLNKVPTIELSIPEEYAALFPSEMSEIEMGQLENYNGTITIQQPVFTGGKILNGYLAARASETMSEERYQARKNKTIVDITNAYYGVAIAEGFKETAQKTRQRIDAHFKVIQAMYDEGLVSRSELLKVTSASADIDVMQVKAENAVESARMGLNFLLAYPEDTSLTLAPDTSVNDFTLPNLKSDIQRAMTTRPDIKAAKAGLKAASAGVAAAWGNFSPDIIANFNYSQQNPNPNNAKPEFYESWNATLAAQWNLISWGDRCFQVTKAKARKREVEETVELVRRAAELAIRNAYNELKLTHETFKAAEVRLAEAKERFRVTGKEFKTGLASNTDFLDASSHLTRAKNEYIATVANFKIAEIKYEVAIGNTTIITQ